MRRRLSSIAKPSPESSPAPPPHTHLDTRLLNADFFNIAEDDLTWFHKVNLAVRLEMAKLSTAHDYMHIQRVTVSAYTLYLDDKHHPWARDIDARTVVVAAMVHGIGSIKYAEGIAAKNSGSVSHGRDSSDTVQHAQHDLLFNFLRHLDCPPDVAGPAALIASLVSFTRETRDRGKIQDHCEAYPALRFVQDADRLDELGCVGIARLVAGGGWGAAHGDETILSIVHRIDTRLVHYVGLMKTKGGRKEAEKRWAQMLEFREGLVGQTDCSTGLKAD